MYDALVHPTFGPSVLPSALGPIPDLRLVCGISSIMPQNTGLQTQDKRAHKSLTFLLGLFLVFRQA